MPFIFSCSKILTNQQIKEDTKSYKTSGKNFLPVLVCDTCGSCCLQFTVYFKLRFLKFFLADFFFKYKKPVFANEFSFSKYPQNYQTIFKVSIKVPFNVNLDNIPEA